MGREERVLEGCDGTDPDGDVCVEYIGGPTVVITIGGRRLLTDPTFSPPGPYETGPGEFLVKTEGPALQPEQLGPIDGVLLSHDQHVDNLDPAGRALLPDVAQVLTTPAAAQRLGGNARGISTWSSIPLDPQGSVLLTALPAQHWTPGSERVTEQVTEPVTGFLLHGTGVPTVYVSGDNASIPVITEIANQVGPVDVAVIAAGAAQIDSWSSGPTTLTASTAISAFHILKPRSVVAVHTRGWSHVKETPLHLQREFWLNDALDRLVLLGPGGHFVYR